MEMQNQMYHKYQVQLSCWVDLQNTFYMPLIAGYKKWRLDLKREPEKNQRKIAELDGRICSLEDFLANTNNLLSKGHELIELLMSENRAYEKMYWEQSTYILAKSKEHDFLLDYILHVAKDLRKAAKDVRDGK